MGERVKRLIKLLILALIVGTLLGAASYAGARARVGQLLGPDPPVGGRTITFAVKGVPDLPERPRAWVFVYRTNRLGVRRVRVYVSLAGKVIATVPANLAQRVEAYARSREP